MNIKKNNPIKLNIFYCSNSFTSEEINKIFMGQDGDEYKIIGLPCSGKANLLYFIKSFETGADGLVLITCSKNECRYLEGNLRSPKRAEEVDILLDEIGMGRGRVKVLSSDNKGIEKLIQEISEFRNKIRSMAAIPAISA